MKHKRPVNLALSSLTFPPMAIASILHRMSGILLFLLLPVMMYFLSLSLHDSDSFIHLQALLAQPMYKMMLWAFGSAWCYHVMAGLRHMVMDCGLGESLAVGRITALLVIALGFVCALFLGVWLW